MDPLMIFVIQALWGLVVLFIGFSVRSLSKSVEENGKSITTLTASVAKMDRDAVATYVTKPEAEPRWKKLHDLSDRVLVLENTVERGHD